MVVVSLLVDVLDVVTTLVVAVLTGSAVVFAEMVQGIADVAGSSLLVVGERRSRLPGDAAYPFGYRREIFFWSLLSAVIMLFVGGGLSFWRGYRQLVEPGVVSHPLLALAVLVLSVVTNAYAVGLSARRLVAMQGSLLVALRTHGHPLVKTAFLRDAVGTTSAVLGSVALILHAAYGAVYFDALGALVVAVLLVAFSLVVIVQARALIAGRAVPAHELERIREAVCETPGVVALNRLAAVHSGASEVHVELDLDLDADLDTTGIEGLLDEIQRRIRAVVPGTDSVRVDLNSPHP